MSWVVRWIPGNADLDAARAWDWGCQGVAEVGAESVAGFADEVAARGFGANVGGRVEPATTTVPTTTTVVSVGPHTLRLDSGQAFGHGSHPTTRLVLDWLTDNPPTGLTVLDVGCGTGVLAIAAALLGAAEVRAIDVDPAAVAATITNATDNGATVDVDDTPLDQLGRRYELVVANLLLADQRPVADALAATVAPWGRLVLAGLLTDQIAETLALYPQFTEQRRTQREGWACLQLAVA